MSNNYTFLPGVVKVFFTPCAVLPVSVLNRAASGLPIAVLHDKEAVRFVGIPTCKKTVETANNGRTATVELQFKIPGRWAAPSIPVAFIVQTASGETYLIGSRERPYPTVTTEETTGLPSEDARQTMVTVKHTAPDSLIPIVI